MASLQEIEKMVNGALNENDDVKRAAIWSDIEDAVYDCPDLDWTYQKPMADEIKEYLNESGLHGVKPPPINLEKLKEGLQPVKVQPTRIPNK